MSYIGNTPGVSSQRVVLEEVISGSPKSAFTPISGYTLGYLDVLVNGVEIDSADYTASDGVTVTLATAAAVGDTVKIKTWLPRGLSDGYTKAEADARFLKVDGSNYVTGNLGVGTNSTLGNSTLNAALGIVVRNQSTNTGYFQAYNANAGTDLKTWRWGNDSSGNLLFQTVNDAYSAATTRLAIGPAGVVSIYNTVLMTGNNAVRFYNSTNNNWSYIDNPATDSTGQLRFSVGSGEAGRFNNSGQLMLGTTTAADKFTIDANAGDGGKGGITIQSTSGIGTGGPCLTLDNPATWEASYGRAYIRAYHRYSSNVETTTLLMHRGNVYINDYFRIVQEIFTVNANTSGAVITLSTGQKFTGTIIVSGTGNDTAAAVFHIASSSYYSNDNATKTISSEGQGYTGSVTITASTPVNSNIQLVFTTPSGTASRTYVVTQIGVA